MFALGVTKSHPQVNTGKINEPPTSNGDIISLCRDIANTANLTINTVTTGANLQINSQEVGGYDYCVVNGSYTVTPGTIGLRSIGASGYMVRGATLTGAADSKLFTLSFWHRRIAQGTGGTNRVLGCYTTVGGSTSRFFVGFNEDSDSYQLQISGFNASGTTILSATSTERAAADNDWHHYLISIDLGTGRKQIYVDDVLDYNETTFTNDTIDFTVLDWATFGTAAGTSIIHGDLAELWFKTGIATDFSSSSNRRLFIDVNGKPVSLGSDGTTPGLGAPIVYLTGGGGGYYDWIVNKGTGGNITPAGGEFRGVPGPSIPDWFTPAEDVKSAFVVVKGDLTVATNAILAPPGRKLFTTIYVTGNAAIHGEVSMTAKGSSHGSGSLSPVTAVELRIANGTYGAVIDPSVPAAGGTGGSANSTSTPGARVNGATGTAGSSGGTGGGGSGGARLGGSGSGTVTSGNGAPGTCFSGGSGGGSTLRDSAGAASNGTSSGGAGGNASLAETGNGGAGGGAGNPAGTTLSNNAVTISQPRSGTGGVLFFIVEGTLTGAGSFTAIGSNSNETAVGTQCVGGGGSGGGSVTVIYGTDSSTTTVSAAGGAGGIANAGASGFGGAGGAGSARKLGIPVTSSPTVSLVDNVTSTGTTLVAMNNINAGDILVWLDCVNSNVPATVNPTGFSQIDVQTVTSSLGKWYCAYKIADGTEDGTTLTGMDGNATECKVLLQYRLSSGPCSSLSVGTPIFHTTSGDPTEQTLLAGSVAGPVIGITCFHSVAGTVNPITTSITPDVEIIPAAKFVAHSFIQNVTNPGSYTWDMEDEGSSALMGFYLYNFA